MELDKTLLRVKQLERDTESAKLRDSELSAARKIQEQDWGQLLSSSRIAFDNAQSELDTLAKVEIITSFNRTIN